MMTARVLLVEDDLLLSELIEMLLSVEGLDVAHAANGAEALDRLRTDKFDLVVLDLMMPVMDGWQFRQAQIRDQSLAGIPVIVVSAAGRERLERIQADAYLSKPVDLDELLGCVTQFCRP